MTAILVILAINITALVTWYAREIYNKVSYMYYKFKAQEIAFGGARPDKTTIKPRGAIVAESTANESQIIRPLSPAQLKVQKERKFYEKHGKNM